MLTAEEEIVRDDGALLLVPGETIEVELLIRSLFSAVQALEQSAIEKGHIGKMSQRGIGIAEVIFVTIECVHAVGGAVLLEPFVLGKGTIGLLFGILAHALIQRGEEKVLQDGLVVG